MGTARKLTSIRNKMADMLIRFIAWIGYVVDYKGVISSFFEHGRAKVVIIFDLSLHCLPAGAN
jgi:hypothetical protein